MIEKIIKAVKSSNKRRIRKFKKRKLSKEQLIYVKNSIRITRVFEKLS